MLHCSSIGNVANYTARDLHYCLRRSALIAVRELITKRIQQGIVPNLDTKLNKTYS